MTRFFTTGETATKLGVTRDCLLFAIRKSGAPEPKGGRIGGRRMFSDADINLLRKWFDKHRGTAATA